MRSQEISERWTNPSAPSMLTKAPKFARLVTRPLLTVPMASSSSKRSLRVSRVSFSALRSDNIRRRRERSTSMMLTSIGSPINLPQRVSGVSPVVRRVRLICEPGTKPRNCPIGTSRPPLLKPEITPSYPSPDSFNSSTSSQSISSLARV